MVPVFLDLANLLLDKGLDPLLVLDVLGRDFTFLGNCLCYLGVYILHNYFKRVSYDTQNFVALKVLSQRISHRVMRVNEPYRVVHYLLSWEAIKLSAL